MRFSLFLFTIFLSLSSFANKQITSILEKYSKASSIEVKIKKIDEKITLGSKSDSQGMLKHAGGKIYLLLESDKKTEFFYDKKITLVEYPDQDFDKDGNRKITIVPKNQPPLISGLLKLFSNTKGFLREFPVVSEKTEKDDLIVELKPTDKKIKKFTLVLNTKEKLIDSIVFVDDVDTKTTLELSELKLNKKIPAATFKFKQLKSDEVITE